MAGQLAGKVAYVTGGSRGIGAAITRRMAQEGADVAFTYLKAEDRATALAAELEQLGAVVLAIRADQADSEAAAAAVRCAVDRFGHIDILVNNAGIVRSGAISAVDPAAVAEQWAVNVTGMAATTREAIKHMPSPGRIIMIGSGASDRTSTPTIADYAAGKAAIAAYGRGWAQDLAVSGITVNTLLLGVIDTELSPPAGSELGAHLQRGIPLGRYGDATEVANVVNFVAGPESSYMTGSTIFVDGGWNA